MVTAFDLYQCGAGSFDFCKGTQSAGHCRQDARQTCFASQDRWAVAAG
jgi:hypothetical protein